VKLRVRYRRFALGFSRHASSLRLPAVRLAQDARQRLQPLDQYKKEKTRANVGVFAKFSLFCLHPDP
jgi:hypothetical protein